MDNATKASLLKRIEEEILNTRTKIEAYKELTKPIAPENAIGRISRMDAINNKSINDAALRKAEEKLAGLIRMQGEAGHEEFGLCDGCHGPIPIGRLMLMPHARRCVRCS